MLVGEFPFRGNAICAGADHAPIRRKKSCSIEKTQRRGTIFS
jgi:hypothetical protein